MTEHFFTAPVGGRYHVVTGQEPHLVENCTDACKTLDGTFVAEPGSIVTVEFDVTPAAETDPIARDFAGYAAPITTDDDGAPHWPAGPTS